jgi:hypothetical protein
MFPYGGIPIWKWELTYLVRKGRIKIIREIKRLEKYNPSVSSRVEPLTYRRVFAEALMDRRVVIQPPMNRWVVIKPTT